MSAPTQAARTAATAPRTARVPPPLLSVTEIVAQLAAPPALPDDATDEQVNAWCDASCALTEALGRTPARSLAELRAKLAVLREDECRGDLPDADRLAILRGVGKDLDRLAPAAIADAPTEQAIAAFRRWADRERRRLRRRIRARAPVHNAEREELRAAAQEERRRWQAAGLDFRFAPEATAPLSGHVEGAEWVIRHALALLGPDAAQRLAAATTVPTEWWSAELREALALPTRH